MREEAVMAKFKALTQNLPRGTEENLENPQSR
jgi:hypothetical protein